MFYCMFYLTCDRSLRLQVVDVSVDVEPCSQSTTVGRSTHHRKQLVFSPSTFGEDDDDDDDDDNTSPAASFDHCTNQHENSSTPTAATGAAPSQEMLSENSVQSADDCPVVDVEDMVDQDDSMMRDVSEICCDIDDITVISFSADLSSLSPLPAGRFPPVSATLSVNVCMDSSPSTFAFNSTPRKKSISPDDSTVLWSPADEPPVVESSQLTSTTSQPQQQQLGENVPRDSADNIASTQSQTQHAATGDANTNKVSHSSQFINRLC